MASFNDERRRWQKECYQRRDWHVQQGQFLSDLGDWLGDSMIRCQPPPVLPNDVFRCINPVFPSSLKAQVGVQAHAKPAPTGVTRTASTPTELQNAIDQSSGGDQVALAGGTYGWGNVTLAGGPPGLCIDASAATLTGTQFTLNSPLHLWDSNFLNNTMARDVQVNASNAKVIGGTHINSGNSGSPFDLLIYVQSGANDVEIAHNLLDSPARDTFPIVIGASTTSAPLRNHVHHNTISNSVAYNGTQGGPAIRLGLAFQSSNSIVEYNLIDNWNDDPETIEIKASDNIIRHNCITNSGRGHISNRQGDRNVYYGNYVDGAIYGIRISGHENVVLFNYVKASTGNIGVYLFNRRGNPPWNSGSPLPEKDGTNNIIRCNIFDGFSFWGGTNDQGAAPFVNLPMGNTITDNYYLGTPIPVDVVGSYFDNGNAPFGSFMAANTVSNVSVPVSGSRFCQSNEIMKQPIAANGATYVPPGWYLDMLEAA